MLIGASAAVYAVSLAGVAGLQYQTDAETAANRAPYDAVVAQTRAANDALEAPSQADTRARALAADYASAAANVTAYQGELDQLAALVAKVQGSAAALPAQIKLPTVTMHGAVGGVRRRRRARGTGARAPPRRISEALTPARPSQRSNHPGQPRSKVALRSKAAFRPDRRVRGACAGIRPPPVRACPGTAEDAAADGPRPRLGPRPGGVRRRGPRAVRFRDDSS